jgi:uncharacterized protein (DUF3084 family)
VVVVARDDEVVGAAVVTVVAVVVVVVGGAFVVVVSTVTVVVVEGAVVDVMGTAVEVVESSTTVEVVPLASTSGSERLAKNRTDAVITTRTVAARSRRFQSTPKVSHNDVSNRTPWAQPDWFSQLVNPSSTRSIAQSTSSWVATRGGMNRRTLPSVPQLMMINSRS